jgi:hypothetical protein
MVRVKRRKQGPGEAFFKQITFKHHLYVVIQVLSIFLCFGFYLMIQSKEVCATSSYL